VTPFFRRKIVQLPFSLGYPYWMPDNQFDINFHVRHSALPKPGDWRQFCILASRIQARPLDLARPPWEMHVIEGLDNIDWLPKGSFAILTKVHHAAVDGSAFAELTWALHDVDAARGRRVSLARKAKDVRQEVAPGVIAMLARAVADNVTAPLRMAGPAMKVLPKLGMLALQRIGQGAGDGSAKVPKTRFNGAVSSQRVFDSAVFELDAFKRIKAAVPGATVNDVVLAVIGGAMREYLRTKGELPKVSLKAVSPVNTRPDKGGGGGMGNNISILTFPLASDVTDPLSRLRAIQAATARTKEVAEAIGAREMTDLSRFAPPATLAFAGRLLAMAGLGGAGPAPLHNTAVSNVPGPTVPLYLLGARLRYLSCVAPITGGMGLFHAVASCTGILSISPTSTPEMLPDPAFYTQCLRDSLRELEEAAARAAGAPPRRAQRKPRGATARPGPKPTVARARAAQRRKPSGRKQAGAAKEDAQ
jgi:WS/DGAT/MGAT family acyltransferase